MRIVFMGSPDFAVPCLTALVDAGHDVAAVYSQPPRPAGRGGKMKNTPVHDAALAAGQAVLTPLSFKSPDEIARFADFDADLAVVVAYGLILPQAVLDAPRLGCVNVHASLLPRWRGAAPIQRAIQAGDAESGVTIMQMEAGLDTGSMLARAAVPITADTTGASLHDALSTLGADLLIKTLPSIACGTAVAEKQDDGAATYAHKLEKSEARIDWARPAEDLDRTIRAFFPWPGSSFSHDGEIIKVLTAEPTEGKGAPGTVLDDNLAVACGTGALSLTRLQRPGRKPMAASDFLRGLPLSAGTILK
ncbi:MAG: methionyl-tRNA formyltransferase [Alphaproteobacteria bacterium]